MRKERLNKVVSLIKEKDVDGFLISNPKNIYYLSGFIGLAPEDREASLYVGKDKGYLVVPEMYAWEAKGLESVEAGDIELVVDRERDGILSKFIHLDRDTKKVLVESDDLKVAEYRELENIFQGELLEAHQEIEKMRMIKESDEIEIIKKAVEITDKTFEGLVEYLQNTDYTRLSELDVIDELRKISRSLSGEGFGFDPIVASGPGSALPHYKTSDKKLKREETLLVDLGIKYGEYSGDLTRTIYLGKAPERFKQMYDLVLQANEKALSVCRAGVSEEELYNAANDVFKDKELDKYFIHGLGHGIGLDIHEEPYLRQNRKGKLKTGMTITIEPGLYFEGEFGIRIEDFVVVREDGCDILSKADKNLIEIV